MVLKIASDMGQVYYDNYIGTLPRSLESQSRLSSVH